MTDIPTAAKTSSRIPWVDVAKGVGIAIVFYGHFVQCFIDLGVPIASSQMKWIYAFHMPMFFMLVGFVYKDRPLPFDGFIKRQVRTRLVPVWVFNIAGMLVWIATEYSRGAEGWVHQHGWASVARHCATRTLEMLYQGLAREEWNVVTWFLVCLFTVELWYYCLRPLVRTTGRLVVSLVCFVLLAILVNLYSEPIHVLFPQRHWWYISSGLTAMVFYQLGILLRRLGLLTGDGATARRIVLAAACLLVTLVTYRLNEGLRTYRFGVVLMVDAKFGDPWWFFVTALAGSFLIVYVSQILAGSRVLKYLGQNTLTLMCMDGILLEFVNPELADLTVGLGLGQHWLAFSVACLVCTVLSLAVCLPVNWFLQQHLPWTIGRTRARSAPAGRSTEQPASVATEGPVHESPATPHPRADSSVSRPGRAGSDTEGEAER